jgi:hypothetical protein
VTAISICIRSGPIETRQIEILIRSELLPHDSGVGVVNEEGGLAVHDPDDLFHRPTLVAQMLRETPCSLSDFALHASLICNRALAE